MSERIVDFLAKLGEGFLWTILIIVILLLVITSRADKE
jgi:hypothetical protein